MAARLKIAVLRLVVLSSIGVVNCHPGKYESLSQEIEMACFVGKEAIDLREALMVCSPPDTASIVRILTKRNLQERLKLVGVYEGYFGPNLERNFACKFQGYELDVFLALVTPASVYRARELHDALPALANLTRSDLASGNTAAELLRDERTIIDILCTMTNDEIRNTSASYQRLYGKTLENALTQNISDPRDLDLKSLRCLITALLQANRADDSDVDENQARIDADILHTMGRVIGVRRYIEIFTSTSYKQLRQIFDEYERKFDCRIEIAIELKFSGVIRDIFLEIAKFARGKSEYFAAKLANYLDVSRNDTRAVTRIIVSRSEIDMAEIENAFHKLKGQSLKLSIRERIKWESPRGPLVSLISEATDA